jgi:hypothetical protein
MFSGHVFEGCGGGIGPRQQLVEAAVGVFAAMLFLVGAVIWLR